MDARIAIDDPLRHPGLSAAGATILQRMAEHPHAPLFSGRSGHRLHGADIEEARVFEQWVQATRQAWRHGEPPDWLQGFVSEACRTVPAYRDYGKVPFASLPTISRADLSADVSAYVPDHVAIAELIAFTTSGTTGHPLVVPSHPRVAARYLAFHLEALRGVGITPQTGAGQVGIVLAGYQERCFTYLSVNPTLHESGLAKLNFHPNDWRKPQDRAAYLDALAPEFISGDPISLAALAELPVVHCPRALLSTSMALPPGLRAAFERRFGCPVLDIYSMNEAGPIGVYDERRHGFRLLQPHLYVEILSPVGLPLAPGETGEITLTGGFNFCLPLIRYRTGDFGALRFDEDGVPALTALQGRAPVRYRGEHGNWINNLEVTHALAHCALAQYALHQATDGSFSLTLYGGAGGAGDADAAMAALKTLFGNGAAIHLVREPLPTAKVKQYTSALYSASAERESCTTAPCPSS